MQIRIKPAKLLINIDIQKVYPELEDLEITPAAEGQSFKSSKYGFDNVKVKAITSDIDTDIKPENIKEGINILGVDGSYSGIDTSDATATAGDLLKDKIAYANGEQITGTIEEYDGAFIGEANIGDEDLIPENIKKGVEIFGVVGAYETVDTMKYNCKLNLGKSTGVDLFTAVEEINYLDLSNVTSLMNTFTDYPNLKELILKNTENVTTLYRCFYNLSNLTTLSELNAEKMTNINSAFVGCTSLKNFGGLKNFGKKINAYTENNSNCRLDLSSCPLTKESLINIINNLYDLNLSYNVANGGTLYRQSLVLGSTNLEKLTAEEIKIATDKGWNVT